MVAAVGWRADPTTDHNSLVHHGGRPGIAASVPVDEDGEPGPAATCSTTISTAWPIGWAPDSAQPPRGVPKMCPHGLIYGHRGIKKPPTCA